MNKRKITIRECLELRTEITGFSNKQSSLKGLINEKTNFKTKYWLNKILEKVASEERIFNKLRDELIKKYGTEENGSFVVKETIDGSPNPMYSQYLSEVLALIEQETEIDLPVLSIDTLDFESENVYPVFMKHIIKEHEEIPDQG